jgi:hypothetical protein
MDEWQGIKYTIWLRAVHKSTTRRRAVSTRHACLVTLHHSSASASACPSPFAAAASAATLSSPTSICCIHDIRSLRRRVQVLAVDLKPSSIPFYYLILHSHLYLSSGRW